MGPGSEPGSQAAFCGEGKVMEQVKTFCLEILQCLRKGLALPANAYKGVHYSANSLICWFRYDDGKLYKVTIQELTDLSEPQTQEES